MKRDIDFLYQRKIRYLVFLLLFLVFSSSYAADTTATFTIAAQWGANNWGTNICLQSGATSISVKIHVQDLSINPGDVPYRFYVYLNGGFPFRTDKSIIDVGNVTNNSQIKVIVADPDDVTKKYGEQSLTFTVTSVPNYTLSAPSNLVCLDHNGNGAYDLKLSPYRGKNGITYEFHRGGDNAIVEFTNDKDSTFTRSLNGAEPGSNNYYVIVTENGCKSVSAESPTISFVKSPKLNEKASYLRYLSQGGAIVLKDLFNGTNNNFDNDYNFEDLSGKDLVVKQGSTWIFKAEEAGEGVYKNIIAYTPKDGTCSNGKITVGTELKILNDKESLVIFLKATKELPICANQEKYPLQVLIKDGCQPPSPQLPEISVGGIQALNVEYVDIEESINCHIYSFEIEPIKYTTSEVDIKVVGLSSAACNLSGTIKIAPPNEPNITGLPETIKVSGEDVAYICGSSSDTIPMRSNPSGGYYTIEKGGLSGGSYFFKPIGNVKFGETSAEDQSLEQFVPLDVFKRIISSNYDSLIRITYTSPKPCPASKSVILKFLPSINVGFSLANDTICHGEELHLKVEGNVDTEDSFLWSFGDGRSLSSTDATITYAYERPGIYQIRFQTNIKDLNEAAMCNNDIIDTIYVGAKPSASFDIYNNYFGESIRLQSNSKILVPNTSEPNDTITSWDWMFSGNIADKSGVSVTLSSPEVVKDPYKVIHVATTTWGCTDTAIINMPIFPVHTITPETVDKEEFVSGAANGWYHSGQYYNDQTKSSWQNIVPVGKNGRIKPITPGNDAWFTFVPDSGGYRAGEKSWVESPVYEIHNLRLPMLSMDTWTDMNSPFDGVSVQFAFVDTTAFGKENWITLGEKDGVGLNWYNSNSVLGAPGGSNEGWTADTASNWSLSAYRLDTILKLYEIDPDNRKRVRFRIVLGTTTLGQGRDGFAFDNFFVGQRNRKIIVEEFCDYENKIDNPENFFVDPQALRIQYHLSDLVPDDEINSQNPYEPSARGLLYGIGKALPRVVLDGVYYDNDKRYDQWSQKSLLERSLITSPYTIALANTVGGDSLSITATIKKSAAVVEAKNYVVQVAIVEKVATGNGQDFTNVLRKMLPNAAGHRIDKDFSWDSTTINTSWKPSVKPQSKIYIITFLQDEDTKEIYQAEYDSVDIDDYKHLYSGVRPGGAVVKTSFNDLILSPNPTSHDLMVKFDGILKDDYTWSITDVLGNQRDSGQLLYGTEAAILPTEHLHTGMYYLKLEGEGRSFIKKFSVVK